MLALDQKTNIPIHSETASPARRHAVSYLKNTKMRTNVRNLSGLEQEITVVQVYNTFGEMVGHETQAFIPPDGGLIEVNLETAPFVVVN